MADRGHNSDRLSQLPDEIIHRILSLVDAKCAVQTSVLAKRWRGLWSSLSVINLDDSNFEHSIFFKDFVENFFSSRDDSSNVFNISVECSDDLEELEDINLIDFIIDHVVDTSSISSTIEVLSISANCVMNNLPDLSVCKSLTTLKLENISTETTDFDLPSLKHLYLSDCRFECGRENFLDPFKDCVNLIYLYFHGCVYYGGIETIKISAPHLAYLDISGFKVNEKFDPDNEIELHTPRLQYFIYIDLDLCCFSTEINLFSMEKISVNVECLTKDTDSFFRLIEFFEIMQRAKFVSLSTEVIRVLSMFPDILKDQSSPFPRMRTFKLIREGHSSAAIPQVVKDYLFGAR